MKMSEEQRKTAAALAAAVLLAEELGGCGSEVYWQARGAAIREGRRRKIGTVQILFLMDDLATGHRRAHERMAAPVWEAVCPPMLRVAEVLRS